MFGAGEYHGILDGVGDLAQAVFWQDGQVHNLQSWLTDHHNLGDQLTGWSLISANAISADGRVIAGVGINPDGHFQGWVVDIGPEQTIPEPTFLQVCSGVIATLMTIGLGRRRKRLKSRTCLWRPTSLRTNDSAP